MTLAEELAARSRFGVKPGLEPIATALCAVGNPQQMVRAIHVAGTNGKGAVCAMLEAVLAAQGRTTGRYTSPHLVRINERFFLNGKPVAPMTLERWSQQASQADVARALTYFEYLTFLAFQLYAEAQPDFTILETGLGGRLDATNVCVPVLTIITRIGLDHCAVLGDTLEKIAAEKAGIIKAGVPVVLGRNEPEVIAVVKRTAEALGAPFCYAPELVEECEIPRDLALQGSFNRENAQTVIAALRGLKCGSNLVGLSRVVWPGRFHRVGNFLIDGAHNPPAARALMAALAEARCHGAFPPRHTLICGFCGDKEVEETLRLLAPSCVRGYAVPIQNPRSLDPETLARMMQSAGIVAEPCASLREAIARSAPTQDSSLMLICGSLFLAGEALVELGAYPWAETDSPQAESISSIINSERSETATIDLPDPAFQKL